MAGPRGFLRGVFIFGRKEKDLRERFNTESTEKRPREIPHFARNDGMPQRQRERGKTRRLRLPGMMTAMERPSGEGEIAEAEAVKNGDGRGLRDGDFMICGNRRKRWKVDP